MQRTNHQNRRLYRLLSDTGWLSEKEDLAHAYSHGRTAKTSELTIEECDQLIKFLEDRLKLNNEILEKSRRRVISRMYDMGWVTENGKADMERLKDFLNSEKAAVKKPLNKQTREELSRTIHQFELMLKKKYEK